MGKIKLEIPASISTPKVKNLLNERPDGMKFEEYKDLRRAQAKVLKSRLRGVLVWKSAEWGTAVREKIPQVRFV